MIQYPVHLNQFHIRKWSIETTVTIYKCKYVYTYIGININLHQSVLIAEQVNRQQTKLQVPSRLHQQ